MVSDWRDVLSIPGLWFYRCPQHLHKSCRKIYSLQLLLLDLVVYTCQLVQITKLRRIGQRPWCNYEQSKYILTIKQKILKQNLHLSWEVGTQVYQSQCSGKPVLGFWCLRTLLYPHEKTVGFYTKYHMLQTSNQLCGQAFTQKQGQSTHWDVARHIRSQVQHDAFVWSPLGLRPKVEV